MRFALLLLALFATSLRAADSPALSTLNPNPKADHLAIGLHMTILSLGELVVEFPQIIPSESGAWEHPLQAQLQSDGASTSVPYPCGARFTYALQPDGTVLCTYSGLPPGTQSLWFPMMIPASFADGGRYAFGTPATFSPFPAAPAGRSIVASRPGPFRLAAATGAGLLVDAPSERQGLTDFRPSWNAFSWNFSYPVKDHPGGGTFVLRVSLTPQD